MCDKVCIEVNETVENISIEVRDFSVLNIISEDVNNSATIGSDGLLFVPEKNTDNFVKSVNDILPDLNGNVQIDYNDLDNLPTIPTATSELTNDSGFITIDDVPVPDLSGLVPYAGATQNVDLGEHQIKTGQVEFDTTPIGNAGVGVMRWNDSDGTLDLGLKGGNVTLQLGQEQVVRVVNKTGSNLLESNYQAVRVNGAQGQRLKVALAQATNDLLSAETIGLVTENIDNNQEGFVTTSGLIRGINTTGSLQGETWADGDMLYLSPFVAGRITNIKPSAPNHLIVVGYVVYAHANNGSIFVKVDNGYELEELHNVTETNYTNPIDTDSLLTFDVTNSLWKRLSWANIKSNLKSYFDTFYLSLSIFNDFVTDVFSSLDDKLDKSTIPSSVYGTNTAGEQTMIPLGNFGTVKGTGTTNRISKFTASGTIGDSQIFDNGTNVGIGTTSPSEALEVNGSILSKNPNPLFIIRDTNLDNNALYLGADFGFNSLISYGTFAINRNPANGVFFNTNRASAQINLESSNNNGSIGFYTSVTNNTTPVERIRINGNGNVGIRITSPQASLDVRAQGSLATDIALRVRNSTDTANLLSVNGQGTLSLGLQASAPTGIEGAIYYNSTDKKHYGFNGTTWNALY